MDDKVLVDKAEYIFSTTVDLLLSIHTNRRKTKNKEFGSYFVKLKHDKVPVYEKADINSKLVGNTPDGLLKIDTNFRINGLSDEGPYWMVHHLTKGNFFFGYIHNDYVE